MRVLILALVGGMALTASTQGAPLASKPTLELGTASPVELAAQACGWASHRARWRDQWVIGIGVTAFRTEEPTAAGMRGPTIPTQGGP